MRGGEFGILSRRRLELKLIRLLISLYIDSCVKLVRNLQLKLLRELSGSPALNRFFSGSAFFSVSKSSCMSISVKHT